MRTISLTIVVDQATQDRFRIAFEDAMEQMIAQGAFNEDRIDTFDTDYSAFAVDAEGAETIATPGAEVLQMMQDEGFHLFHRN